MSEHPGTPDALKNALLNKWPWLRSPWTWMVAILGALALLFGLFSDTSFLCEWLRSQQTPDIEIRYFQENNGDRQLMQSGDTIEIDQTQILGSVSLDDLQAMRSESSAATTMVELPIPVNLSLRNNEGDALELVRVVFSYAGGLRVESTARSRLNPSASEYENEVVYEHDLGTLEGDEYYTPLPQSDVLFVPYAFMLMDTIVRSSEGVPDNVTALVGMGNPFFGDTNIVLGVRVYALGRPPVETTFTFTVPSLFEPQNWSDASQFRDADGADRILYDELPTAGVGVLDQWRAVNADGAQFAYTKLSYEGDIYQIVEVDGVRRKVVVDQNGNGLVNYEMIDLDADGVPDTVLLVWDQELMFDWKTDALP
ncbi:MAG: hypothetical protein IT320_03955 [Anaerolineae bacterium]|nr:hypothetical protein [Anaerolineae bacterium]